MSKMDYPEDRRLYKRRSDPDGHSYRIVHESPTEVWLKINKLSADVFKVSQVDFCVDYTHDGCKICGSDPGEHAIGCSEREA